MRIKTKKTVGMDTSALINIYCAGKLDKFIDKYIYHLYLDNIFELIFCISMKGRKDFIPIIDQLRNKNIDIVCANPDDWFDTILETKTEEEYNKDKDSFSEIYRNCPLRNKLDEEYVDELMKPKHLTTLYNLHYRSEFWKIVDSFKFLNGYECDNTEKRTQEKNKTIWESMSLKNIKNEIQRLMGINPKKEYKEYMQQEHRKSTYYEHIKSCVDIYMEQRYPQISRIVDKKREIGYMKMAITYIFELIIQNVIYDFKLTKDFSNGVLLDSSIFLSSLISNTDYLITSDDAQYRICKYVLEKIFNMKKPRIKYCNEKGEIIYKKYLYD